MTPFIIEQGRARMIVNRVRDDGCIMLDIDGAGVTMFLDDKQMMSLAGELIQIARRVRASA